MRFATTMNRFSVFIYLFSYFPKLSYRIHKHTHTYIKHKNISECTKCNPRNGFISFNVLCFFYIFILKIYRSKWVSCLRYTFLTTPISSSSFTVVLTRNTEKNWPNLVYAWKCFRLTVYFYISKKSLGNIDLFFFLFDFTWESNQNCLNVLILLFF